MSPTRALPAIVLVAALAGAVSAAPAPPDQTGPTSEPSDAPDTIDNTSSRLEEEVRYPAGSTGPEREGWGAGSGRIFSQLVAPLVQLVVNQFLQATNLVGALAGADARPNAVLSLFSASLGASTGGRDFPTTPPAPLVFGPPAPKTTRLNAP